MRQVVVSLMVAFALVTGAANAQSGTYTAVSVGFPLLVNVHFGMEDLLAPGADLRLNLGGALFGVGGVFVFGGVASVDALFRIRPQDDTATVVPYAGVGAGLAGLGLGGSGGSGMGFGFTGAGVLGVQVGVEGVGFFIESRVNLTLAGGEPLIWPNVGLGAVFRN